MVISTLTTHLAAAQHPLPRPQPHVDVWFVTAHVKARVLDLDQRGNPGPIEWATVRVLRSDAATRTDFTPDSSAGQWGSWQVLPIGMVWLTTTTDTGTPVTVLDSVQKQFYVPTLHNGFPGMGMMLPPRGPSDTTSQPSPANPISRIVEMTVTIDSLGSGPVLRGHHTLHYHQTQRTTIQTDLGQMMALTVKIEDQEDLDIATDIPNAPPIDGQGVQRIAGFAVELATTPKLVSAIRSAAVHYPRGVIMHMDGRQTIGSFQGPLTRIMTLDTDRWGTMTVAPSLFVIPAQYTRGNFEYMP